MEKNTKPALIPIWPDAGNLMNVCRASAYKAAERGEIPTVTIGRRKLVVRSKFYELLGIEE